MLFMRLPIWILTNKKNKNRKGKVQLINGVHLCSKMRKTLGSKRHEMSDEDIATITKCFGKFEDVDSLDLNKPIEQKSSRGRPTKRQSYFYRDLVFSIHLKVCQPEQR